MFAPDFISKVAQYAALTTATTELLKRTFKLQDTVVVIGSFLIAFAVCLPEISSGVINYAALSICSGLAANGFWKVLQKPKTS